jgi:hypothetical protein
MPLSRPGWRCRSTVSMLLLAALPAIAWAQDRATVAPRPAIPPSATPAVRITGGVGLLYMHLPAFSYTEGSARRPVMNPAQEATSLALGAGLEGYRGRAVVAGRFLSAFDVLDDRWAYVGMVTAGLAVHGARSLLTLAAGPTLVSRERVPDSFLNFRGLCYAGGCDNAANNDGGTLTTGGAALTASAEYRLRGVVGFGAEVMAATGAQRYVGGGMRITIGR